MRKKVWRCHCGRRGALKVCDAWLCQPHWDEQRGKKVCIRCQQERPLTEFQRDRARTGYKARCKACERESRDPSSQYKAAWGTSDPQFFRAQWQDERIAVWAVGRLPPNRQIKGRCAIDEVEWDDSA